MMLKAGFILAILLLAGPAQAQSVQSTSQYDIMPEIVTVYRESGPAWWKVRKGDSIVLILGLPPGKAKANLKWDRRTLQRRLKGSRLILMPYTEWSGFDYPHVTAPLLPEDMAKRVVAATEKMGERVHSREPINVQSAMHLRYLYFTTNHLTTRVNSIILSEARSARVPIVTPPVYRHYWDPERVSPKRPEIAACFEAILKDIETPASVWNQAAEYWAVGDVEKALAVAPPKSHPCQVFWPGHRERTIGFQTHAISQSLEKPGKVIAVAYIEHLVTRDGILENLRAQGYTIEDPSQPLTD